MSERGLGAFVLVVTRVGTEHKVKEKIERLAGEMEGDVWVDAKPVFGEYDLVVTVEARDLRALDKLVSGIRGLDEVVKTVTLIAV
ncbi:MAG: Lrp/AsnC ligand binding domain-containing protein [Fervidicoccaceae archaeon]